MVVQEMGSEYIFPKKVPGLFMYGRIGVLSSINRPGTFLSTLTPFLALR